MSDNPEQGVAKVQRILLVDDSKISRKGLKKKIKKLVPDIYVEEGVNGQEAIDKVTASYAEGGRPFHLIFLDHQMPEVDGLTALSAIRAINGTIPIVMLTADVQQKVRDRAASLGVTDFIGKTTESTHLARILGIEIS